MYTPAILNTPIPPIPQTRTPAGMAFLLGLLSGVVLTLLFTGALVFFSLGPIIRSSAAEDFTRFREAAARAPVDQAERQKAVQAIEQILQRIHDQNVSAWEVAGLSSGFEPLLADCQITAEEWPTFVFQLRKALETLGLSTQSLSPPNK